ncbi:unnamed protein product [Polarella glacialis]|uniref:Uncharacterized protein n=1 Tax=Polarella glacialis TaxID=89957 RepID=A0A813KXZ5_POLGL|nr:unnamed protein product [Polarella glacialis]
MAAEDKPDRLEKSGPELFRELLRVYPVAEVDDYWRNGAWQDAVMRTDIVLVEAHRKEAGAPDAPELSEVEMPATYIVFC